MNVFIIYPQYCGNRTTYMLWGDTETFSNRMKRVLSFFLLMLLGLLWLSLSLDLLFCYYLLLLTVSSGFWTPAGGTLTLFKTNSQVCHNSRNPWFDLTFDFKVMTWLNFSVIFLHCWLGDCQIIVSGSTKINRSLVLCPDNCLVLITLQQKNYRRQKFSLSHVNHLPKWAHKGSRHKKTNPAKTSTSGHRVSVVE